MYTITDEEAIRCLDYIRDAASVYAKAKSERVYFDQFRKSKKAMLQRDCPSSPGERVTDKTRESYAYAHQDYLDILSAIKISVEEEEKHKFLLVAAQAKLEAWRTMSANERGATK